MAEAKGMDINQLTQQLEMRDAYDTFIQRELMYMRHEEEDAATEDFVNYCNSVAHRIGRRPLHKGENRSKWSQVINKNNDRTI